MVHVVKVNICVLLQLCLILSKLEQRRWTILPITIISIVHILHQSCLPRSAHITTSLAGLHWLRAAERIKFKLVTLAYRCLHCSAPRYMFAQLTRVTDIPSRWHPRSSATDALLVRPTRLVTVGIGRFRLRLPNFGINFLATSPLPGLWRLNFRRQLKTFLFRLSYPLL